MHQGRGLKNRMTVSHIALLRGINLGAKNKVPMKDLVGLFEDAGCEDVSTYIQSGNVLFAAKAATVKTLPAVMSKAIAKRFGFEIPVILRSVKEWETVIEKNPFVRAKAPPESLHVAFLKDSPLKTAVAALDPERSPPDTFEVVGANVYLCCPNGFGRTKLSNAWFDSKLKTVSTIRNWRTVLTLRDLAAAT
jgi:uncharacterized protein (DUF1697 family)